MSLDQRARDAATALRESAAGLESSPEELRGQRRRRVAVLGGGSAAVLVLAALAVALLVRDDGDGGTQVATTATGVPRLLPTELPDGFELVRLFELDEDESPSGYDLRLYGDGDAGDPFARGDLGLMVQPVSELVEEDEDPVDAMFPEGDPAPLDRPAARFVDEPLPHGARGLAWQEDDRTVVLAASRSMGREELLRVASSVRLENGVAVLPDDSLPTGFEPLGGGSSGSLFLSGGSTGYTALYARGEAEPRQPSISLSVGRGGSADLDAARWMFGPEIEEIELRDRPALLASLSGLAGDAVESSGIVWLEDDSLITLFGSGVERDVLLAAAESLEPVPDEEWERLRTRADRSSLPDDGTVVAEGELDDGRAWRIAVEEPDGTVCLEVRSGRGTSGSCGPGIVAPPGETVEGVAPSVSSHEDRLLHGAGPPETERTEVRSADGDVLDAPIVGEHEDLRFYLVALPEGFEADEVLAFDGDGNELGRWPVREHPGSIGPPPDPPPDLEGGTGPEQGPEVVRVERRAELRAPTTTTSEP